MGLGAWYSNILWMTYMNLIADNFEIILKANSRHCFTSPVCLTPWTIACQASLSLEFPRQQYCSELPFPSLGDLPYPGIKPRSPALQADSLPCEPQGKPYKQSPCLSLAEFLSWKESFSSCWALLKSQNMRDPILVPATLRMPHHFDCTFWCLSDVSLHLTQDTSPGWKVRLISTANSDLIGDGWRVPLERFRGPLRAQQLECPNQLVMSSMSLH